MPDNINPTNNPSPSTTPIPASPIPAKSNATPAVTSGHSSNTKTFIIAGIAAIVLIIGGFLVYKFFFSKPDDTAMVGNTTPDNISDKIAPDEETSEETSEEIFDETAIFNELSETFGEDETNSDEETSNTPPGFNIDIESEDIPSEEPTAPEQGVPR